MNFRLTTAALLILVILAGIVVYMSSRPAPEHKKISGTVLNPAPITIRKITYSRAGKPTREFVRQGAHWKIAQPIAVWGRDFKISDIGDTIRHLKYKYRLAVKPAGPHSPAALGLAPTRAVVTLTDNTGKNFTLNIGRRLVSGRLYVQPKGKTHWVYVVHAGWFSRLSQPIARFRDRNLTRFHIKTVAAVTLRHGPAIIRLHQIQGRWVITQPVHTPARPVAISNWLSNLQSLHAHRFSSVSPATAGLNSPVAVAQVQFAAPAKPPATMPGVAKPMVPPPALVVKFGRYTDLTRGHVYVSSNQDPGTAVLATLSMNHLVKTLDQLRDHALTRAAVGKANRIIIQRGAGIVSPEIPAALFAHLYLIKSAKGHWLMGTGPTQFAGGPLLAASSKAVAAMTKALAKLRATSFIDSKINLPSLGLQPPLASLNLQIPGRLHPCHILIGRRGKNGLLPMKRPSWPSVYLVHSWKLAALLPQATALRSGQVAAIAGASIQSVVVSRRHPQDQAAFSHQSGQWKPGKLMGVAATPAEAQKIAQLAAAFGHLRTKRWIAVASPKLKAGVIQIALTISHVAKPAATPAHKMKMPMVGPQKPILIRAYLNLWPPSKTKGKSASTWRAVYKATGSRQNWVFVPPAALVKAAEAVLQPMAAK